MHVAIIAAAVILTLLGYLFYGVARLLGWSGRIPPWVWYVLGVILAVELSFIIWLGSHPFDGR